MTGEVCLPRNLDMALYFWFEFYDVAFFSERSVLNSRVSLLLFLMSCFGCQILLDEPRPFPQPKGDVAPTPTDMTVTVWDFALTVDKDQGDDAEVNSDRDVGVE